VNDVVNLNRVRKAKARAEARDVAARNRVSFGLTRDQKAAASAAREKSDKALDAHKREP
jgi:hypothetical protein